MSELQDKLKEALQTALSALEQAADKDAIEQVRVDMLGRKGVVTAAMKGLGGLSPEERPLIGKAANQVKSQLGAAIEAKLAALEDDRPAAAPDIDVTLPGRRHPLGAKHPISRVFDECLEIFRRMGFVAADGPDIEDEYHNFDALNTPADHPSRDLQDTLYLFDGRLLRTHTSPVQVRVMENQEPPVRIVSPGRCYRRDTQDATHTMNFHQIEGIYVDRGVSLADLKGTLLTFAQEMFGDEVEMRVRPHFFPFTEPSIEFDLRFTGAAGKAERWLEIGGAGMVHPAVLENVGYDSEVYTGFAFGIGIERLAMIKYRIPDIRLCYENNLRFLRQF